MPKIERSTMDYLKKVEHLNMTYSVDMLRLSTRITYNQFSELEFRFKTLYPYSVKKYYESTVLRDFKYNYIFTDKELRQPGDDFFEQREEHTFWLGFLHNTEISSSENAKFNLTIEFNPNKLKDFSLILCVLGSFGGWKLKSYDLAIDVPINILDICLPDKKRKKDLRIFSNGFDDLTYYIGRSNGRVKIYNKKKESHLDISGELTRIETTIEHDGYDIEKIQFYHLDKEFIELFTNEYLYTFKDYDDKTLFAVLYALQCGFDPNMLTRAYKQKVKQLLEGGHKLIFKKSCAETVLKQVIVYYFVNNKHMII